MTGVLVSRGDEDTNTHREDPVKTQGNMAISKPQKRPYFMDALISVF